MTTILDVGRNMELMMKINLCLIPLKKILYINYTYGNLKNQRKKYLVEGNTIFYFSENGW